MFWTCSFQVGCVWEQVVAAQVFSPSLERDVCRSSESGVLCLVARARVSSLERAFAFSIDLRAVFLRSSESFLCLVAQATKSSLERAGTV